jgi:hypothetical protein
VEKRRVKKYPKAFRQMAMERMRSCEIVSELAGGTAFEVGWPSIRAKQKVGMLPSRRNIAGHLRPCAILYPVLALALNEPTAP